MEYGLAIKRLHLYSSCPIPSYTDTHTAQAHNNSLFTTTKGLLIYTHSINQALCRYRNTTAVDLVPDCSDSPQALLAMMPQ